MLMPLTFLLMFYMLLTLDGSGDKSVVTDVKHTKKRDTDAIEDDYDPYTRPIKRGTAKFIDC